MVGIPCIDIIPRGLEELNILDYVCMGHPQAIEWQTLIGAAILASVAILVFLYLFAVLFRNDKTIAWVKMEMYELVSTVIIVIGLIAIMQGLCSFNAGWIFTDHQLNEMDVSGLDSSSHIYRLGATYMRSVSDGITKWMCWDLVGAIVADMGSSEFKIHPMGQGFITTPMAGFFAPIKLILNNAMIGMVITYIINEAMFNIFKYSIVAFPTYFLPFGIFFRSFEPTRRFGGTLIALSIAFLVVYPIALALSFYIWQVGMLGFDSAGDVFSAWAGDIGKSFSEAWKDLASKIGYEIGTLSAVGILLGTLGGMFALIAMFFSAMLTIFGKVFSLSFFFFGGVVVWKMALAGFVLPAFNTIILVYSMRSMGQILGEPVDITSLTRVI